MIPDDLRSISPVTGNRAIVHTLLEGKWRTGWQAGTLVVELNQVAVNLRLGIKFR